MVASGYLKIAIEWNMNGISIVISWDNGCNDDLGKFHHDRAVFSLTIDDGYGESSPFMALFQVSELL